MWLLTLKKKLLRYFLGLSEKTNRVVNLDGQLHWHLANVTEICKVVQVF